MAGQLAKGFHVLAMPACGQFDEACVGAKRECLTLGWSVDHTDRAEIFDGSVVI